MRARCGNAGILTLGSQEGESCNQPGLCEEDPYGKLKPGVMTLMSPARTRGQECQEFKGRSNFKASLGYMKPGVVPEHPGDRGRC